MPTLLILTEENPQLPEIQYITEFLGIKTTLSSLKPHVTENTWKGEFTVDSTNKDYSIHIRLFKGKGACVDYLVYDSLSATAADAPILALESTKTTDKQSRNSSVYQRFTKLAEFRLLYPNTPLVMFYTTPQNPTTKTAIFGLQLLKLHGVHVVDCNRKDLTRNIPALNTTDDIIAAKNNMTEKKGNISVRITKVGEHDYEITGKLCKKIPTQINNDPNIGLITGICTAIFALDKLATFVVKNHGVTTTSLKPTAKFWYANRAYSLKLDGCSLDTKGCIPPKTKWVYEGQSEKSSTVLFEMLVQNTKGYQTIFHNHGSSARSSLTLPDTTTCCVPKTCGIPDIVFLDKTNKTIYICEGKIMKDIKKGETQLDDLKAFETFLLGLYKDHTICKGLCIYTDTKTISESYKYPVWFTLNDRGVYSMNF